MKKIFSGLVILLTFLFAGVGLALATSITIQNPIGASTVAQVLTNVLNYLKGVIITVSVIFIIIGALMYILSGGSEKRITQARACIAAAIIGLAVALAAPILLNEIIKIFGNASNGLNTASISGYPSLQQVALNVLSLLLSIFGIIAIISLVVGGGMYLTAYGEEKKIATAKSIVKYAIVGIIIALASLIIVQQVMSLVGAQGTSTPTSSTSTYPYSSTTNGITNYPTTTPTTTTIPTTTP